jgi:O-antigen ligase
MMAYQTNPANTWWGAPLVALDMRFSMLAAVFTILGLFFGRRRVPKLRPVLSLWEVGVLALIAAAGLSLVIGHSCNPWSRYAFEKTWKMLLFVFIIGRLATTRRNLRLVLWTLVLGSLYLGYDAYTASPSAFWLGRLERIGGPDFSTTSGTAAHLAAMLPLIGTAFLITPRWRWRALAGVSGVLTFNAMILCRTRSAFVGLLCGLLAAVLMAPRIRRYRIHFLLFIGAGLAFSLTDSHFWTRMGTLADRTALAGDAAAVSRSEIWKASVQILVDHPQGIGVGNFRHVIGQYDPRYSKRSAHNTLVVCLTELGVHGGVLFISMVIGALWLLYRAARLSSGTRYPVETRLLVYGLLVSLVTYFVAGLGTERFYCESFWWVLVLPLCVYRVAVREVTEEMEVPALARAADWDDEVPFLRPVVT